MNPSIAVSKKRGPGRPRTTGTGTLIGMRWHSGDLVAIDAFAKHEGLERTEAIRALVRIGLDAVGPPTDSRKRKARRAPSTRQL